MKFCTIICEYDPFHKMHAGHMKFAREASGCDFLVCLMSGNFVQRGRPAVTDRFTRAKHALLAGADVVIELPLLSAAAAADDFAFGAARILDFIGAEALSFGCESGNAEFLRSCAEFQLSEEYDRRVRRFLSEGISYPKACGKALRGKLPEPLENPNDILAAGYLRECGKLGFRPEIYPMKRNEGYNDTAFSERASSSAIRLARSRGEDYSAAVPSFVFADDDKWTNIEDYEKLVFLSRNLWNAEYLAKIRGISEGIENRILSARASSYGEFFFLLKTKRYTEGRLRRALLDCLLGVTSKIAEEYKKSKPYSRLLGFRKESEGALKRLAPLFSEAPRSVAALERKADGLYEALAGRIIRNYPVKI